MDILPRMEQLRTNQLLQGKPRTPRIRINASRASRNPSRRLNWLTATRAINFFQGKTRLEKQSIKSSLRTFSFTY